jgi:hypothetical protein
MTGSGLRDVATPAAGSLATHLQSIFGPTAVTILHYGSRAQGRAARHDSAFAFFVIVTNYRDAYRAAAGSGACRRPGLAALLARFLPPNAISVRRGSPFGDQEAKCLIISKRDFQRECSARAHDHFVQARMIQTVRLVWAGDADSAEAVHASVRQARHGTFDWARVFLPPTFDLAAYCRTVIDVCFIHELRAEARGHSDVLFEAQRPLLFAIYGPLLAALAERGVLERAGDRYVQRRAPRAMMWFLVRGYFRGSKLSALETCDVGFSG